MLALPTTNTGGAPQMQTRAYTASFIGSLIRFPLLPLVPSSATVTSADLTLQLTASVAPATLDVHLVTSPWVEITVTYNTMPTFAPVAMSSASLPGPGVTGPIVLDVTTAAQQWVSGAVVNEGVLLRQATGKASYASSNAPPATSRPTLNLCFTVPG